MRRGLKLRILIESFNRMCTVMYVKVANYNRVSSLDSPKEEEAKFLVSKILDKVASASSLELSKDNTLY